MIERKADFSRTIQNGEDLPLQFKRQISVAWAKPRAKGGSLCEFLRGEVLLESITKTFDALCADGLEKESFDRRYGCVSRDQSVKFKPHRGGE